MHAPINNHTCIWEEVRSIIKKNPKQNRNIQKSYKETIKKLNNKTEPYYNQQQACSAIHTDINLQITKYENIPNTYTHTNTLRYTYRQTFTYNIKNLAHPTTITIR